jgi:hypothetical protein
VPRSRAAFSRDEAFVHTIPSRGASDFPLRGFPQRGRGDFGGSVGGDLLGILCLMALGGSTVALRVMESLGHISLHAVLVLHP